MTEKHSRNQYCWFCLPDKYVSGEQQEPPEVMAVFLPSSPPQACPFVSGDEPDDGRMWKPPHVFGVNANASRRGGTP